MSTTPRRLTPEPQFGLKGRTRSRSVSPSPVGKTDISIKIDPASGSEESGVISDPFRYQKRYIIRSYEYDRELLRRQHAMIAVQPMSTSEEIEEKRRLLRIKADARRQADAAVKMSNRLGGTELNQQSRGRSRTRSLSRSVENLATVAQAPLPPFKAKNAPLGSTTKKGSTVVNSKLIKKK